MIATIIRRLTMISHIFLIDGKKCTYMYIKTKVKLKVKLQSKGCANKREIKTCVTDGITGNKSRKLDF